MRIALVSTLLCILCGGCASSTYRIGDSEAPLSSTSQIADKRTQKEKVGWEDRAKKVYALGDHAVMPNRLGLLQHHLQQVGRAGRGQFVLYRYDILLFAGRSEGHASIPTSSIAMGLVAGILQGLTTPAPLVPHADFALVVLAGEYAGNPIAVVELEPFKGFSDMPAAHAAVRIANQRALRNLMVEIEKTFPATDETPNKAPEPTPGSVTLRATSR